MHPQIVELLRQLESASVSASELTTRADDRTFGRRPRSGGWSAAECIAHLTLTTEGMLPRIDAALERSRAGVADEYRYRRGLVGNLLAWSMEPPARIRSRTLPTFVPDSEAPKDVVLSAFERSQAELARRIREASGRNLDELRIVSPFNERVSYNLYAAFCVLLAHERRHLWQAERALQDVPGPRA